MSVSQAPIEPGLRRSVQTNRLVLLVCTVGLVGVLGFVASTSDGTTWDVLGLLGLTSILAGAALLTLDAWVRLPRPAPRAGTHHGVRATVVQAAPGGYVALLLVAAGLALIAVSLVMAPDPGSLGEGRRGGTWVYVVAAAAPLLVAGALALLVRRDRAVLTPDRLVVRRLGRERSVPWDAVRQVGPVAGNPGLLVRIGAADGTSLLLVTRQLSLSIGEVVAVVRHLASTPGDRVHLGTPAALTMIEDLRRRAGRP